MIYKYDPEKVIGEIQKYGFGAVMIVALLAILPSIISVAIIMLIGKADEPKCKHCNGTGKNPRPTAEKKEGENK